MVVVKTFAAKCSFQEKTSPSVTATSVLSIAATHGVRNKRDKFREAIADDERRTPRIPRASTGLRCQINADTSALDNEKSDSAHHEKMNCSDVSNSPSTTRTTPPTAPLRESDSATAKIPGTILRSAEGLGPQWLNDFHDHSRNHSRDHSQK